MSYTFGGRRLDTGQRAPINRNDRNFKCGFGKCDVASVTPLSGTINPNDLINLDFTLIDIDALRENLTTVSDEVNLACNRILDWLTSLEQQIALKIQTGDIEMDRNLFNKLNSIIPKFTSARKVINLWRADYINMSAYLSDLFSNYSEIVAKVELLDSQNTMVTGLRESVVTLAKQHLTKSKSIQNAMSKILSLDSRIRTEMQTLTFKIKELSTGILRYGDGDILNLSELSNAAQSLVDDDSPLVRIQTQLSKVIASTPLNFTLQTREPTLLPSVNMESNTFAININTMPSSTVLEKLRAFKDTILYTSSTQPTVDALETFINAEFKNDAQYTSMIDLINRIRQENRPVPFIDALQIRASNPDNIYLTIDTIRKVIDNLNINDAIYGERLNEILNTAVDTAKNIVNKVSVDSPMDESDV